jgi:hypothetical protein
MSGPTRLRSTSQRRDPGSHIAPALRTTGTSSAEQHTAIIASKALNFAGPTCVGMSGVMISRDTGLSLSNW